MLPLVGTRTTSHNAFNFLHNPSSSFYTLEDLFGIVFLDNSSIRLHLEKKRQFIIIQPKFMFEVFLNVFSVQVKVDQELFRIVFDLCTISRYGLEYVQKAVIKAFVTVRGISDVT